MLYRPFLCALALVAAVSPVRGQGIVTSYNLLITGGRLLDGTGNPWYYGDIGIVNGRIAAVGRLGGASAERVIDARGKMIAPGRCSPPPPATCPRKTPTLTCPQLL